MPKIVSARALADYRLEVVFDDGTQGIVPLRDRLFGPMFEPLRDADVFAQVSVDEFGAVTWPTGADLAPDALYERLRSAAEVA